ncbi:MAG TPA: autotransporter-associated beta strand repeat-containing protein, partial [Chthoniobacteraceae bacterium]|nr:autotransporter-associated beta strand repeat-containing protein [Chthoniobacteraceae bacterium]
RATITRTDGRTYFANVAGGMIVPQTTLTPLAANSNSGTTNFQVSGDIVTTSPVATGTLRIDTTTSAGSLDLAGGNLTFGRTALLMDGANDFEIRRSSGTGTIANVVVHQFGTGALIYSATIATGGGFTKYGGGLLIGNMDSGAPGSVTILEGVYRIAKTTAAPTGSTTLSGGGVLELGSGDFVGGLGTGNGQVRILSDGGFSAFGATRMVNLGGAGASIAWEQTNFLPGNAALVLSSRHSNATLEFVNPLNLGASTRTVRVEDGSAAVDARLSGALTGSGSLVKTGPGTLELTGASTYFGSTTIREGVLSVNGRLAGSVNVDSGTLQGTGDGNLTGFISGGVTVGNGIGTSDSILSPGNSVGSLTTFGPLSLASDSVFKFEFDSVLGTADKVTGAGISIAPGSIFQPSDVAVASVALPLNTTFIVLANMSITPTSGTFSNLAHGAVFTVGPNTFRADYLGGSGDLALVVVVPEPGSFASLGGAFGLLLGFRRARRQPAS